MAKRSRKVRSAPLYIQAGGEVVSLVAEVAVLEARANLPESMSISEVYPLAVHVIDSRGVHSLPVYSTNRARILMLLFLSLLAPLQYAFFKRRGKK